VEILFLVSRVPYPLEKGDKLRAFHHLRLLAERHSITIIALTDQPVHPDAKAILQRYCSDIHIIRLSWASRFLNLFTALFTGKPFSSGYFYSNAARRTVDRIIEQVRPAHIYCQLTRVCEYVLHIKDVPKTLDYQDAFAKGFERRVDREPFFLRWLYRMEHTRLLRYEAFVFNHFENTTIISAQDREFINHPNRDQIIVVPNGVDFDYFQPRQADKDYDLVFAGNMGYPPNIEGVLFLVNEILPYVWQALPRVKLLVAGATPTARIRALESNNVHVSGWVDDMRESYARAKIFIAPMLISIGLQNKLLEAMAMRLPCITSELANNALGGTHDRNVLVCSSPQEYASAILRLLEQPEEATKLSRAGHEFVKENYDWGEMTRPLLDLIERQ
jgi:sugar transferase (PEP-CTERM/EpsH1 system associated)